MLFLQASVQQITVSMHVASTESSIAIVWTNFLLCSCSVTLAHVKLVMGDVTRPRLSRFFCKEHTIRPLLECVRA